jgi:hypothetical protein
MTLDTESLAPLQEAIKKLADRPVEAPQKSTLEPQIAKYLGGLHEVLAKLAQSPQRAAAEAPDLSKYMEGLSLALTKLAERPAPVASSAPAGPTAVGAGGADFGQYMAGLQEALTKLADRPAAAAPSGVGGADFGKYMAGLQEALTKLAERPVQIVGGTPHGPAPLAGSPGASAAGGSPAHIPYLAPPPAAPQPDSGGVSDAQTQDAIDKVLQALRKIAEMVRGPQSRTILLDGRLVEAFDALREAEDMEDVLRALRPIRKSNAKPQA